MVSTILERTTDGFLLAPMVTLQRSRSKPYVDGGPLWAQLLILTPRKL